MNVVGMIHLAPMKLASASWSEDTPSIVSDFTCSSWMVRSLKGMDAQFAGLSQGLVASVTSWMADMETSESVSTRFNVQRLE